MFNCPPPQVGVKYNKLSYHCLYISCYKRVLFPSQMHTKENLPKVYAFPTMPITKVYAKADMICDKADI